MQNLQQKGLSSRDRPRRCPTLMRQDGRARNTDVWTFVSFGAYAAQDTAEIVRHRARPGQSTARLRSTVASTADLATTLHFLWANRLAELARHIGQGSSWWAETPCRLYQVLCVYDSRRTMTVTAGHDDKCIVAREIQAGHHDCHRCKLTPKTSSSIGPRRSGKPIKHPCRVPGVLERWSLAHSRILHTHMTQSSTRTMSLAALPTPATWVGAPAPSLPWCVCPLSRSSHCPLPVLQVRLPGSKRRNNEQDRLTANSPCRVAPEQPQNIKDLTCQTANEMMMSFRGIQAN